MITTVLTVCLGIQTIKTIAISALILTGKEQMKGLVWTVAQLWCLLEWFLAIGIGSCLFVLTK